MKVLRFGFVGMAFIAVLGAQSDNDPVRGKEMNERGLQALSAGDFATARELFTQSLRIWLALGKEYEPHAATGMLNLGDVFCAQNNWQEAGKLFERALELNRRSMGSKHARTLSNLNRLGNVYAVQGAADRAEPLFAEALRTGRELYPDSLNTAHSLIGLSALHGRDGRLRQSLAEAEEGLAITLRAVGENDSEAGMAYAAVGQMHRVLGEADRAEPLLRKALAILEHSLGPNHPRFASVLSQEGLALLEQNKLALAEKDLVRAVSLLSQTHSSDVELAVAEHNLALLRARQKKYSEAESLLSRAVSLEEQYTLSPGQQLLDARQFLADIRAKKRTVETNYR